MIIYSTVLLNTPPSKLTLPMGMHICISGHAQSIPTNRHLGLTGHALNLEHVHRTS